MTAGRWLHVGDTPSSRSVDLDDLARHFIVRAGWDFTTPGRIPLQVRIVGATARDLARNTERLAALLLDAEQAWSEGRTSELVSLHWGGLRFDLTGGNLTPVAASVDGLATEATLELHCLPVARGVPLVVENLLQQSEDFASGWTLAATTVSANATAAPDGTTTADKLEETTANAAHRVYQDVAGLAVGQNVVFSWWAKAGERTLTEGRIMDTANTELVSYIFDLADGTVEAVRAAGLQAGIEPAGDGWYRCWIGGLATATTMRFALYNWTGAGSHTYAGTAGSGHYVWGAQVRRDTTDAPGAYLSRVTADPLLVSNGSPGVLVRSVPGDEPALPAFAIDDLSTTGVINRIGIGRLWNRVLAAGDYDPWVDLAALGSATPVTDASHYGGGYVELTTSSLTPQNLARAVMPAGARNRGAREPWLRVWDSANALAQPTGLSATAVEATVAALTQTTWTTQPITVGVTGSDRKTSNVSENTATLSGTSQAGSLLIAIGFTQTALTPVTPTGFTLFDNWSFTTEAGNELYAWLYMRRNAPATSSVTWNDGGTPTTTDPSALQVIELIGADTLLAAYPASDAGPTATVAGDDMLRGTEPDVQPFTTTFDGEASLALFWTPGNGTGNLVDFWFNGYDPVFGANQMFGGMQVLGNAGSAIPQAKARLTAAPAAQLSATIEVKPKRTSQTTTTVTYTEPTPGSLPPGNYSFRVQPVDRIGTLGNASATSSPVTTLVNANGAIDLAWSAPAAGDVRNYRVTYLAPDGRYRWFDTPDASTSVRLTTLDGDPYATGFPATTGAAAPPARLLLRSGTLGTPSAALGAEKEVILTGAGAWRLVPPCDSYLDLPPAGETRDGERPEWATELAVRSANGRDVTVRVDVLWLPPHAPGAAATLTYPGLTLATKRRWIAATEPTARALVGWLEDLGSGAEVGGIHRDGAPTLLPGDNLLTFAFEQAAGLCEIVGPQARVALTLTPRYRWRDWRLP